MKLRASSITSLATHHCTCDCLPAQPLWHCFIQSSVFISISLIFSLPAFLVLLQMQQPSTGDCSFLPPWPHISHQSSVVLLPRFSLCMSHQKCQTADGASGSDGAQCYTWEPWVHTRCFRSGTAPGHRWYECSQVCTGRSPRELHLVHRQRILDA